jgi:hypothetical protein
MATKIRQSNLDNTVLTGHTELSELPADNDTVLIFDATAGAIKKIQTKFLLGKPTVSSVSPTNVNTGDGTGNHTIVITGTDFDTGATASLLKNDGSTVSFSSVTRNSATQITGVVAKSSMLNADEPFDVKVTNGNGQSSTLENQINVNAQPVFVTASGSLGNGKVNTALQFFVNATDPESAANVTFELQSGSLPPGFTITNIGADGGKAKIAGTDTSTSAQTTFNFVLRAVDAASNVSSRAFSIRIDPPVSESFTSTGTFSVPSGVTSADVLVVGGGGGGGGGGENTTSGGGGGAGGLIYFPSYPLTPGGTVAITIGDGGPGGAGGGGVHGYEGGPGTDTTFAGSPSPGIGQGGVLTAKGGGRGGGFAGPTNNAAGGSGGGGFGGPMAGGTATQPTQSGNSGAYGFGNDGGPGQPYVPGSPQVSGGGGGSGAEGQGGHQGGVGGVGKAYTIADGTTSVYYAAGGGGAPGKDGGTGGGAPGGNNSQGGANKGGGGGGGYQSGQSGGSGGKGIVVVRY